jgi:DNA-binding NarL/FixJ family response regulator
MSAIRYETAGLEAPEAAPLAVLIADDHPLMLAGVRRALESTPDIVVVGEAHTASEVLELVARRNPELVLLDLRMPGMSGTECIAQIRASWPEVKVVVLSAIDDPRSIDSALSAGASAYVVKSVIPSDIASVLRQAVNGSVFHGTPGARRVSGPAGPLPPGDEEPALTDREQTILAAVASGKTTAAISEDLWVSEHTVKFHLTNIYRKLEVPNRTAAVRYAIEHGLA